MYPYPPDALLRSALSFVLDQSDPSAFYGAPITGDPFPCAGTVYRLNPGVLDSDGLLLPGTDLSTIFRRRLGECIQAIIKHDDLVYADVWTSDPDNIEQSRIYTGTDNSLLTEIDHRLAESLPVNLEEDDEGDQDTEDYIGIMHPNGSMRLLRTEHFR